MHCQPTLPNCKLCIDTEPTTKYSNLSKLRVSSNTKATLEQSPIRVRCSTLVDFKDRTRTGISKLICRCAPTLHLRVLDRHSVACELLWNQKFQAFYKKNVYKKCIFTISCEQQISWNWNVHQSSWLLDRVNLIGGFFLFTSSEYEERKKVLPK